MGDVPRQDWAAYEARAAKSDAACVRGLTTSDRFALYVDLFAIVWGARRDLGVRERLERWSWNQKIAIRLRMVDVLRKLDEIQRAYTAANHSL